jgi:hypothetical protein
MAHKLFTMQFHDTRQHTARDNVLFYIKLKVVNAVFSIMISSAVAEALFNKYSYARNRFCSSIKDGTAASVLVLSTQELKYLIGNVKESFLAFFESHSLALTDKLNWT